ncbi:MAG TPA: tRNA uridine-5-carboxymethylaminomethyl(34) synthesis enzyme MnmG [Opitutae bacterium]|nr:tRNA uridine-5-carboxymethylaminomethyl(34) synthesis enzyme MnmG [Opitutae bacterium]HCY57605.1 tRNA uridine-5-carboxymethylaminomethyl(34) synthesis enzyme MnmG [Opitutae bacterium]|tara:strand:+ start:10118 stop:11995 length:1878 start_codon:yes stop_codon:yes gene_type:complete
MKSSIGETKDFPYDVIVCGAGHAGCEAALAAARMGSKVLIITGNLDTIAQMSCNPAIGGQAKGQIVREIDALGGEMGLNADAAAIQYKLLNTSKGPAVQAPRAQCDKKAYQLRMKHIIELSENISMFQALVDGLVLEKGKCTGIKTTMGIYFYGKSTIVTTGTFLQALMHIGNQKSEGGRLGDHVAKGLSGDFKRCGIELSRFKTGTPPRLLGSSIDFGSMEEQKGDKDPTKFAFYDTRPDEETFHVERKARWFHVERKPFMPSQVSCFTTNTTKDVHELIRTNLDQSPLYQGDIKGTGPRYCPSIEDKVVKFENKDSHKLHLEPEGLDTDEWYVNGLSTSLPFEIQCEILKKIPGLENAKIIRPAYAVEYDYAPATQLQNSLESNKVENLFFAGQINGTSGYEEAAAQGLVAGINASNKSKGVSSISFGRDEGYIGVLIDDLVTKGTTEPYRMFTSRAEYRLLFNHASSELRYLDTLRKTPLISAKRLSKIEEKNTEIDKWIKKANKEKVEKNDTFADLIRKGRGVDQHFPEFNSLQASVREEILYRIKYDGYLLRELRNIEKMKDSEKILIPDNFDFLTVKGLRRESSEKLDRIKPQTLAQASRVSGVNPADISVLMVLLGRV